MTRTYAARQLLALGPLSFGQFTEITGWPAAVCRRVLSYLVDDLGEASRFGRVYRMTHGTQLPDVQELATQGLPSNGTPGICKVCARSGLGLPAADADVQAAFARGCSEGCAAGGMGREGVKA